MGCSAAKNVQVDHLDSTNGKLPEKNEKQKKNEITTEKIRKNSQKSNEPPLEDLETPVLSNLQKKGSGLSFELAFEEEKEESIIKKHPPKRFQTIGYRESSPVTLEKLQQKLEEAEIRREQIIAQRIYSAKQRNGMKRLSSGYSSNTEFPDYLKVPTDEGIEEKI